MIYIIRHSIYYHMITPVFDLKYFFLYYDGKYCPQCWYKVFSYYYVRVSTLMKDGHFCKHKSASIRKYSTSGCCNGLPFFKGGNFSSDGNQGIDDDTGEDGGFFTQIEDGSPHKVVHRASECTWNKTCGLMTFGICGVCGPKRMYIYFGMEWRSGRDVRVGLLPLNFSTIKPNHFVFSSEQICKGYICAAAQ